MTIDILRANIKGTTDKMCVYVCESMFQVSTCSNLCNMPPPLCWYVLGGGCVEQTVTE